MLSRSIVAAALLFLVTPIAARAQCIMFAPPERFERVDAVFRGKVIATRPTGETGAHQIVEIATIQVTHAWKGADLHQLQVGADRPFRRNVDYLIFAAGDPLSTTLLCRWAEPVNEAEETLAWLDRKVRADLSAAEARWAANKPASYEFALDVLCFCPVRSTPQRFRVTNGRAVALQDMNPPADRFYGAYDTVEKIFAAIRAEVTRGAHGVDIRYDAKLGYPVLAKLDPRLMTADDERTLRIVDFRVIK